MGNAIFLCVLVASALSAAGITLPVAEVSERPHREVSVFPGRVVPQVSDGRLGLWGWGSVGGSVWSVSSFSREGQSASRRNAYNEADCNLHYDYALEICDE